MLIEENIMNIILNIHDAPWGEFIRRIKDSMEDILVISLCAAVTQQSLLKEKEWLNHASMLSSDEKEIIELLDYLLTKTDSHVRVVFVTEGEKNARPKAQFDKMMQVFERIASLISSQNEYLDDLKKKLY
jgi:hypothetical protein